MNRKGLAENSVEKIAYRYFILLLLSMVMVVLMPLAFSGNANEHIKSQAEKTDHFLGNNETESLFSNNPATNKILVFSKTSGYRHESIPNGIAAIQTLGQQNDFTVDATEDAAAFTDANLAQYKAVVFLSTTGDVLNTDQQAAFERFIRSGKGFVGIHSASDTERNWGWYGGLVGAFFQSHPANQTATLRVENRSHPSTTTLPASWTRFDEWYNFQTNPRGNVQVLATLDESTYTGGTMGADHPIAWYHAYDGGRSWYTALGHTIESYSEPLFQQHILGGIQYGIGRMPRAIDYDGDGKTDISIFRPSVGQWWYSRSSSNQVIAAQFGNSTDKLVPADFTGDGKTDLGVFRPTTGEWFVLRSEDGSFFSFPLGTTSDISVVGDFDADGKADPGVFRPSSGVWYISKSSGGTIIQRFGANGDFPVVADYDGDGKSDIAVFRPSVGEWWLSRSTGEVIATTFGNGTDKPVQGDYTGDGKADIAVFRPSTGEWFILRSEDSSFFSFPFGTNSDIPAPGDYDGDGKFDPAVFRPSTATWFVNRSTAGILITNFGAPGDRPIPNAFVPESVQNALKIFF